MELTPTPLKELYATIAASLLEGGYSYEKLCNQLH